MPAAQPVPEPEPKITPQATLQAIEAIFSHLPVPKFSVPKVLPKFSRPQVLPASLRRGVVAKLGVLRVALRIVLQTGKMFVVLVGSAIVYRRRVAISPWQ